MKPILTLFAALLLTLLSVARAADELVVYPPVPGLAGSEHYKVRVRSAGDGSEWQNAFAWETACKTIEKALGGFGSTAFAETVSLFYNPATPQHAFAAGDIRTALEARKVTVEVKKLSSLNDRFAGKKVVIALASDPQVAALLEAQGGGPVKSPGEQAYALRTTTAPEWGEWGRRLRPGARIRPAQIL